MNLRLAAGRFALLVGSLAIMIKLADLVIGAVDPAGISHFANHNAFTANCVQRRKLPPGNFAMDFAIPGSHVDANVSYQINSLGFRGHEYTREKPPNTWRIVVLGDSVTFGWGVAVEDRFTDVVERGLAAANPGGRKIEILNLALPGYETMHDYYVWKTEGSRLGADAIVVVFNRNDVQNDTAESLDLQFLSRKRVDDVGFRARVFVDEPWRGILDKTVPNLRLLGLYRYIYSLEENDGDTLSRLYASMKNGVGISLKLLSEMKNASAAQNVLFGVADLHDVAPIRDGLATLGVPYRSISYPNDITDMSLRNSAVDPHPNAAGHALHAKRFESALRDFGMIPAAGN